MAFGLMKWNPYRDMISLDDDWNQFLGDFWMPQVDVEETREEFIVKAALPGLKREDVQLRVEGDSLVITGERRLEQETKDKMTHLRETAYGRFQRVLGLPAEVEGAKARATYEAGILTVRLPKAEQARPKEIAIEVK